MENNPINQITAEIETNSGANHIGMLKLRTANKAIRDAALRPDPDDL